MPALSSTTLTQRDTMRAMDRDMSGNNNAWSILAITGSWCFLAFLVVVMRVYARAVLVRYLGWDDIVTIITMIFGVAIWVCFVGESHSALGKHWQDITPVEMGNFMKWQFAHSMLLVWALQGMKIAFMLFLLRLSTGRLFRYTLFAVVGFMTVYTIANWFTILFACAPISANWTSKPARCMSVSVYTGLGLSNSIFGMLTDAILALIPVPIVSKLQLNLRTKICLMIALGMGLITVICGAIKTYYQYNFFDNKDRVHQDNYFVWGALELYVGIIAASLVSLKPLVASFLDKAKSTLATTAVLVKSLQHSSSKPPSPKLDEKKHVQEQKQQKPLESLDYPQIQVFGVQIDDLAQLPDTPIRSEKPESITRASPLSSNPVVKATAKPKRRPAPLNKAALKSNALEVPSMGGVLLSPSPTFLPSGASLDFFDLIQCRDPERLEQQQHEQQQEQQQQTSSSSAAAPSTTTTSTERNSLTVPSICGVLTSPSPTWLPPADQDFFSLLRGRDPETLGAVSSALTNASRRTTMVSVPEEPEDVSFRSSRRATLSTIVPRITSIDLSEPITATVQTVKRIGAGEVRRRPSMAPSAHSATSAFLCPPIQDSFRESRMFFHVMSSGQFREEAQAAAHDVVIPRALEDMPLSPMSLEPWQRRVSLGMIRQFGEIRVLESADEATLTESTSRERIDSGNLLREKEE